MLLYGPCRKKMFVNTKNRKPKTRTGELSLKKLRLFNKIWYYSYSHLTYRILLQYKYKSLARQPVMLKFSHYNKAQLNHFDNPTVKTP